MKFAIRVDDVGWTAEPAEERPLKKPDAGLEQAKRLHAALGGLPWLAGVIPTALDKDGRDWLLSEPEGLTVAMHGVTHKRVNGFDGEFRDKNTLVCQKELGYGLDLLGMRPRHFIPPFNHADAELLFALRALDFKASWGQYAFIPTLPYRLHGVTLVPSLFDLYSATVSSMGAGQAPIVSNLFKFIGAPGYAVITLHVPWELAKCDQGSFEGVRELADRVKGHVISPDQYLEEAK